MCTYKLLGFCEALLAKANKKANEATNVEQMNFNIGAVTVLSAVIEFIEREAEDENCCGD